MVFESYFYITCHFQAKMIVFRFQNTNRYINKCLGYYYIELKNTSYSSVLWIQSLSFPNIIRDKPARVVHVIKWLIFVLSPVFTWVAGVSILVLVIIYSVFVSLLLEETIPFYLYLNSKNPTHPIFLQNRMTVAVANSQILLHNTFSLLLITKL